MVAVLAAVELLLLSMAAHHQFKQAQEGLLHLLAGADHKVCLLARFLPRLQSVKVAQEGVLVVG